MILAFSLSMPNVASWHGKWSGAGSKYTLVKTFKSKKIIEKANQILANQPYHYNWTDGWSARIHVSEVTSKEARKLRKESEGFCGYDWMVNTIIQYGKPLTSHQIKELFK